jgi:hypothetical protein
LEEDMRTTDFGLAAVLLDGALGPLAGIVAAAEGDRFGMAERVANTLVGPLAGDTATIISRLLTLRGIHSMPRQGSTYQVS